MRQESRRKASPSPAPGCSPPWLAPHDSTLGAHAGIFCLGERIRPVLVLLGSTASDGVVGAGAQVHGDVVNVAHDVRILAERRHDVLLRFAYVFATTRDNPEKIVVVDPLERILQRGRKARSVAVRTVADVALRMVAAKARIDIPVHRAILRNLVGGVAFAVEGLAVHRLCYGRIAGTVSAHSARPDDERNCSKRYRD